MRTERLRVGHPEGGPQRTKLAEQDSTDVNLIMDSWVHTGAAVAGHLNPAPGRYGDFSSGLDYRTALTAVRDAEAAFAALPPKVRNHCENDPGQLLDMYIDPDRRDELEKLGMVEPAEGQPVSEAMVEKAPAAPEKDPEGEASSPEGSDLTES